MCYNTAIMTSWLRCRWLTFALRWFRGWLCVLRCGIRGNIVLIIGLRPCSRWSWISAGTVEDSPGYCLPLWCKADCQTQRLQVAHLIQILSHCALEKYSKIHRVGEEYNPWTLLSDRKVQSDSDGVALSYPLSRKKKVFKRQPYAGRCILNAQRHKTHSLIIACTQ